MPLFGPGQGSTCGPLFWLLVYWLIVETLDPTVTAIRFVSAYTEIITTITGVSFVNDTGLGATSEYEESPQLSDQENQEAEH
jgi:hypothetical protein